MQFRYFGVTLVLISIILQFLSTPTYAAAPVINSIVLNTTNVSTNDTNQNLTAFVNATDADGDTVKVLYNWYINGTSVELLNIPLEGNGGLNGTDYSGYSNHLNSSQGNTYFNATGGHDGTGAYELDGTGDYLTINSSATLTRTDNFTVVVWVQRDANAAWDGFVGKLSGGVSANYTGWSLIFHDTLNQYAAFIACGGVFSYINASTGTTSTSDFGWHQVALSVNSQTSSFYIDGVLQNTSTVRICDSGASIVLGRFYSDLNDHYLTGKVDDLTIWNKSLSSQQLLALYNNRTDLIVAQETEANQTWNFSAVANANNQDSSTNFSSNVTIVTGPPNTTLTLNSTRITKADNISGNGTYQSETSLVGTMYFNWFNGSSIIFSQTLTGVTSGSTVQSNLSSSNYSRGENLSLQITPFDGTLNGSTQVSATIQIQDAPATHNTPVFNSSTSPNNFTNSSYTIYNQSTADADGDSIFNVVNWYLNGNSVTLLNIPFEPNGVNISTTGNNATDYSGFGNNQTTLSGGVNYTRTGGHDGRGAYFFNGSNGFISIPASGTINVTDNFTVTVWGKRNASNGYDGFVSKLTINPLQGWAIVYDAPKQRPVVIVACSGSFEMIEADPYIAQADLNWHFFALTVKNGRVNFYVDGVRQGDSGNQTICNSAGSMVLGRYYSNYSDHYLNGYVDDLAIWNRTLSSEQILSMNSSGMAIIAAKETKVGENWSGVITPNDGFKDGSNLSSNFLVINARSNTTPVINSTNLNFTTLWMRHGTSQYLNITNCTNEDGGTLTYNWTANGTLVSSESNFTFTASNFALGHHNITGFCWNNNRSSNISFDIEVFPSDAHAVVLPSNMQTHAQYYPFIADYVSKWLKETNNSLNTLIVYYHGDIVNDGGVTAYYDYLNGSMSMLDGLVRYYPFTGNHDLDDNIAWTSKGTRNQTNFNTYFPLTRFASQAWWGGNKTGYDNVNTYQVFTVGSIKYLFITLELCPSNDALNWAGGIAGNNSDKHVAVFMHSYLNTNGSRLKYGDYIGCGAMFNGTLYPNGTSTNDGDDTWTEFVSKYPNIFWIYSAHVLGTNNSADTGVYGNIVQQTLHDSFSNYTGLNDHNAETQIYLISESTGKMYVRTYDPWFDTLNRNLGFEYNLNLGFTGTTINYCAPISASDSYTLNRSITENSTGGICLNVVANNILLDCNGSSITGNLTGATNGVKLNSVRNLTLRNCNILNYSNAVFLFNSTNISIYSSNFSNSTYGVFLNLSNSTNLTSNRIFNNSIGIYLFSSLWNLVNNNTIFSNSLFGLMLNSSHLGNNASYNNLTNNSVAQIKLDHNSSIFFSAQNTLNAPAVQTASLINTTRNSTIIATTGYPNFNIIQTDLVNFSFTNLTNITIRVSSNFTQESVLQDKCQAEYYTCTPASNMVLATNESGSWVLDILHIQYNMSVITGRFNEDQVKLSRYSNGWENRQILAINTSSNYVDDENLTIPGVFAAIPFLIQGETPSTSSGVQTPKKAEDKKDLPPEEKIIDLPIPDSIDTPLPDSVEEKIIKEILPEVIPPVEEIISKTTEDLTKANTEVKNIIKSGADKSRDLLEQIRNSIKEAPHIFFTPLLLIGVTALFLFFTRPKTKYRTPLMLLLVLVALLLLIFLLLWLLP